MIFWLKFHVGLLWQVLFSDFLVAKVRIDWCFYHSIGSLKSYLASEQAAHKPNHFLWNATICDFWGVVFTRNTCWVRWVYTSMCISCWPRLYFKWVDWEPIRCIITPWLLPSSVFLFKINVTSVYVDLTNGKLVIPTTNKPKCSTNC